MAIDWGAWEGGSPNRLRIGIDVSWEAITHGETAATATIKIYLDAEGNWSDTQTINFTGSISGSITFSNNQNNNNVLRETKSYTYNYPSNSYGGTGISRTFGANLTGAFNGATPSNSVSSTVPGRPYGPPLSPTNVNTTRVSESSAKTTWTNRDTAGEPWASVHVQRDDGANDVWNTWVGSLSGGATSFTDSGLSSNYAYRYRVKSRNGEGDSAVVEGDLIYTTPAVPASVVRTGLNGANQVITWDNNVSTYMDHRILVERSVNGGAWTQIAETARNSTTYTDTYGATHAAERIKYRVRARTNGGAQGTLYSAYSAETTETTGVTTPPDAPTNLSPAGNTVINPNFTKVFTWQHHSTDTSPQSGYQIQWRVVGAGSWTVRAKVLSATPSATLAAATFPDNSDLEWQVRTWGAASTGGSDGTGASPFSASALFKSVGDPNLFRERKRVVRLDLDTGKPESSPVGVLPPIGSILMFGGPTAPSGWLICDGSLVSTTTYQNLFGVIGHVFNGGVDPGSGQFKLPDLRRRVGFGVASNLALGQNENEADPTLRTFTHIHTTGTTGSGHTHNIGGQATDPSPTANGSGGVNVARLVQYSGHAHGTDTGTSGSGHTHNVSNNSSPWPFLGLNHIIKV
jgi:microcystin-dependent protein